MSLDKTVRFVMREEDKTLLREIARADGDANMSATLRRLIRAEASRRGLDDCPLPSGPVLRRSVAPRGDMAQRAPRGAEG